MHHNPPVNSNHAKAVLMMTSRLAEEGCMIITSNTDEQADPQIFAQNPEMLFVFYFIRADPDSVPDSDTLMKWKNLADHHQVEPYYIPVNTETGNFDIMHLNDIT